MEIGLSREIGKTQRLFSSVRMKSSISVLASAFAKSAAIGGLRESPSAALCLRLGTCRTSKSNS